MDLEGCFYCSWANKFVLIDRILDDNQSRYINNRCVVYTDYDIDVEIDQ